DKELEHCTFTPHVNVVSRRAAVTRREALGERHLAVDERLFDESVRRDMDRAHLEAEQAAKAEEKLRQECTFRPELVTEKVAAKFLQQRRQQARQAGTGSDDAQHATGYDDNNAREAVITEAWGNYTIPRGRSRYRQASCSTGEGEWSRDAAAAAAEGCCRDGGGKELAECTFTPAVIGARKGMGQAQEYLQFDVVERLTGAAFRNTE
ncbi:unnamed protein product, partial [Sphacelaria rigidula]